jgi:hypothetical protein
MRSFVGSFFLAMNLFICAQKKKKKLELVLEMGLIFKNKIKYPPNPG